MAILISTFLSHVDGLVDADDNIMSQIRRYRNVVAAVERYSNDRPDTQTDDSAGDGGNYYVLTSTVDNWTEGFSKVIRIQFPAPVIASDEMPVNLDQEDWQDDYWADVSGTQTRHLYLPRHAPAATDTMRITYTIPWIWTASGTTTPVAQNSHGFSVNDYVFLDTTWQSGNLLISTHQVTVVTDTDNFTAATLNTDVATEDFFAICHLSASRICQALATKFAATGSTLLNVDSSFHVSKAREYMRRAEEYMDLYLDHMGLLEGLKPASQFVDLDTMPGWPAGRQYIFHHGGLR